MNSSHFQRETIVYTNGNTDLSRENYETIQETMKYNGMIGFVTGYYDSELTISNVSEYFLHNLGYRYDEFMEATGGSLKKLFYGENQTFLEPERFPQIHGSGEGQMITKEGVPVYVHMWKQDSVDSNGVPIWILTAQVNWIQQNLQLINNVIRSGHWYFDCDKKGQISNVFWSHEFRRMMGYHDTLDFPNELSSWSKLIHPDDRDATLGKLRSVLEDKSDTLKFDAQYRMKMADGTYEWFRSRGETSRRLDGSVRRLAGIFVNIQKEKETQMQIKKGEAFHMAFTESNLCEYYLNLRDNTFESLKTGDSPLNQLEKGETWDEFARRYIDSFVREEDKSAVSLIYNRNYIAEKFKEGRPEVSLECQIKIDGRERLVRNVVMPGEEDINSQYAIIFVRDITEAKKEAEAIKELTQKNTMMDQLLQGTIRLVDWFAVADMERDAYQYYGLDEKEGEYPDSGKYSDILEMASARYKMISDHSSLRQAVSIEQIRSMLKQPEDIYKFEYCTYDETKFKSMAVVPVSWNKGVVERIMLIAQDITQEKQLEIKSRKVLEDACEAANRANQAKTDFLTNMSHDIRTPMNAIVGMTAIAGANIENQERVVDCLGKITQSSRHLLSLINEVLDMSRIESGKLLLAEEEFNLMELVDNLVTMTKTELAAHHHNFEVRTGKVVHEDVCGDSLRIQQVITNIMSNAIKYTPDGGNISFSLTEKENRSGQIGCYEFVIEDDGVGMTEEFKKIMFDPFSRADDKRTSQIPGTGLGLAIARNIVHMMNGSIEVESQVGKGSRFIITIFLKLQEVDTDITEQFVNLPVLVVDDDVICCESAVEILHEIGIQGEWVTSGKEAIRLVEQRHQTADDYFCIIVDWKMPNMDGIETTRRIRKIVGREVTIIVLTAYDYSEIEQEARQAGVDEFIVKPLFRSRLTATFHNIVNGKSGSSARYYLSDIANSDYTGKRILLVEDNELNREIAKEIIEMTGAAVDVAENGQEAIEMMNRAEGNGYDLTFMDIQMPVMNGYEAAAGIRSLSDERKANSPIIAMTANAFAEDVILAKNAGMNEHLAKPLDMNKLNDVLKRWL